jgi:hypothetical protein
MFPANFVLRRVSFCQTLQAQLAHCYASQQNHEYKYWKTFRRFGRKELVPVGHHAQCHVAVRQNARKKWLNADTKPTKKTKFHFLYVIATDLIDPPAVSCFHQSTVQKGCVRSIDIENELIGGGHATDCRNA